MKETEDVASKRKAYREMRDLLKSALDIVNEVQCVMYILPYHEAYFYVASVFCFCFMCMF